MVNAPSQRAVTSGIATTPQAQPPTGGWYTEQGASINRIGDRQFVGGATKNNGTNAGSQPDWLTTGLIAAGRTFAFQQVTQFAALTNDTAPASNAILGAARTSLFPADGYGAIGVLGVGWNDNTTKSCGAWGGYFEGFRLAAATGPSYGVEIDAINFGSFTAATPYAQPSGQVIGLQIASGAQFTGASDSTAAVNIQANGAKFGAGIIFGATSLTGTDGTGTGTAVAMRLARGHLLQWMSSNTVTTTQILSTSATAANSVTVNFAESATLFSNSSSGKNLFGIINIGATACNYVQFQASGPGNATQMLMAGDDTNIDLQVVLKGTGKMWIGAWASNADAAVNGYITVKDSSGNVRKLATIA